MTNITTSPAFMTRAEALELLETVEQYGTSLYERYMLLRLGADNGNSRYRLSHQEAMLVLLEPVSVVDLRRLKAACIDMNNLIEASTRLDELKVRGKKRHEVLASYVELRCRRNVDQISALESMTES